MAVTRVLTQVTWDVGSDASDSLPANSNLTSNNMTLDATCVAAQIQLKCDNSTTPAADDYVNFYVLQTSGDPDTEPDSADEYDTPGHAIFLARVQPVTGEDPAIVTVPFPLPQKGFQIYAEGDHPDGTTNAITISCQIIEQRVS